MRQMKLIDDNEIIEKKPIDSHNTLNELNGTEWIKNTVSVWYQRGLGKEHPHTKYERLHPAPFAYMMVERLLSMFTKKGDTVLDPFCGIGSTLKACDLNGRYGTGIELSPKWIQLTKERLKLETSGELNQKLIQGDSREVLKKIPEKTFHFIVTSPPYWSILNKKPDYRVKEERLLNNLETKYSENINDLANIESYEEFLTELQKVFLECHRVQIPNKYIAVVVTDFRHKSKYFSYHSDVMKLLTDVGYIPKGIVIYVKNAKKIYPYGYPYEFVPNVVHEYILILKKDKEPKISEKKKRKSADGLK